MKPMLEFNTRLPPKAQEGPKRRRMKLKSPRNPRVRYVALRGLVNRPTATQPDNTNFELAIKGAKWVSPQFSEEQVKARLRKNTRANHLKGQLFPEQPQANPRSRNRLRDKDGGCARTRPWDKENAGHRTRGLTHSQDISLYPSAYPLTMPPEDSICTQGISTAITGGVEEERGQGRSLLAGNEQGEDFLSLCSRRYDGGTSGSNSQRTDGSPLRAEGENNHRQDIRIPEDSLVGGEEGFSGLGDQGRDIEEASGERNRTGPAGGEDFLPLCAQGKEETGMTAGEGKGGFTTDQQDSSRHGNVEDISSLLSSMSIDEKEHSHDGSQIGSDSTHLPEGPTHNQKAGTSADSGSEADPTHLSSKDYDSDATHLSDDSDSTHLSGDAASTHLSGGSDSTHLSDSAHFSETSDTSEKSRSTHLSGAAASDLSEDYDSTHLSGDAGHVHRTSLREKNVQAAKVAETYLEDAIKPDFHLEGNLEAYVDELGSDSVEIPLHEVTQLTGSVSNPLKSGEKEPLCDQISEGRLFQPPSFSTPFRNAAPSCISRANSHMSVAGSRSSVMDRLRVRSPLFDNPRGRGHTEHNSRSEPKAQSPMDIGTPAVVIPAGVTPAGITPCFRSGIKSILKKRHLYWSSQTPRNLSKSVTFKFPLEDSDGGVVLAMETPEHLWCTPHGNGVTRDNHLHDDTESGLPAQRSVSVASNICLRGSVDSASTMNFSKGSMEKSLEATVDCSREESIGTTMDSPGESVGGSVGVTVEPTERDIEITSTMENAGSLTRGIEGFSRLSVQQSLASGDIACCLMDQLGEGFSPTCSTGGNLVGDHSWPAVLSNPLVTSLQDSELEAMSVLAMETPCEYWESLPINFINSTFST